MEQNEALRKAFIAFALALLDVAKRQHDTPRPAPSIRFQGKGWVYEESAASRARGLVHNAIYYSATDLTKLPGAQAFLEHGLAGGLLTLPELSNDSGAPVADHQRRRSALLWMELAEAVKVAAQEHESVELTQDQLGEICNRWIVSKVEPSWFVAVPLVGFTADAPATLGDWSIERFEDARKQEMLGGWFDLNEPPIDRWDCARSQWMLFRVVPESASGAASIEHMRQEVWSLVTSLRLHSDSVVGAPVLVAQPNHPFGIRGAGQLAMPELGVPPRRNPFPRDGEYKADAVRLTDIGLAARVIRRHRAELQFALGRFNTAYHRTSHEDALVDLTIALEASLLHGRDAELKNRLAMRGAALLRRARDPQAVYAALSSMYDVRSSIVHNGKAMSSSAKSMRKGVQQEDSATALNIYAQLTRDVLREFVALVQSEGTATAACDRLDSVILRSMAAEGPTG